MGDRGEFGAILPKFCFLSFFLVRETLRSSIVLLSRYLVIMVGLGLSRNGYRATNYIDIVMSCERDKKKTQPGMSGGDNDRGRQEARN